MTFSVVCDCSFWLKNSRDKMLLKLAYILLIFSWSHVIVATHKIFAKPFKNFKTSYFYWYYIVVLFVNLSTTVFRRLSIHAHVGIKLWYFILATCATLQKIICQLFLIWNCSSSSPSVWWSGARKEILRNVNTISKEII